MIAGTRAVPSGPASILIVEDEAVVALDLKGELETLGYDVVGIADTALQALEYARRWRPDLTLMDIMLKGDVDGIQTAQNLRRELGTPVVFLTSFSDSGTVARAARTAAYGYLTKPFQIKELRAGIEIALWKSQMERRLRDADRWFALALRCVQDGVVAVDTRGAIRFMNTAAERLTGWTSDEAAGQAVDHIIRFLDERDPEPTLVLRALAENRVTAIRYARLLSCRDGASVPVDESAAPILDEQGASLGAVLVLRDAGQRLRQETMLRASENRFRNAFDFAPLGMALVSLEGEFLQVNDALCRMLGGSREWLLARSNTEITAADDVSHEETRLRDLSEGRQAVAQFEKRYLRAYDGQPVWGLVNASLLREDDAPTCYLYQVHDLTAHKEAAAQLAELATERIKRESSELASRSKSEFLSRVSHEMRTPLNAVLGFANLLRMQRDSGEAMSGIYSDYIVEAGQHLLALVDDLLDLQRITDGSLRLDAARVALDEVAASAIPLLLPMAEPRGVRLERSVAADLRLHVDETRLRQIFLNLGSNAIKYNLQGGSVMFSAERVAAGRVRIGVQDTGIGMSQDQLDHLFEPFNRLGREALRVPGVGLGLVITRKLVEEMGGTMSLSSTPANGTLVTLEFPESV